MRFLFLLALAMGSVSTSPTFAATSLDRIVAVVNDGVILQSELDQALEEGRRQLMERGLPRPTESVLRTQVLERLVLTRVQTQRAHDVGIRVDDRELNETLTSIAARQGLSLQAFAQARHPGGQDYAAVREQVRDEILIGRLRSREVEGRVLVTDKDIELYLANQGTLEQSEFRVSHILVAVPDGASSEVRARAREQASRLLKRLRAGEDFAALAVAHSDGQQALQGGDLDWRAGSELPELFADAVQKMKPGALSDILENAAGLHLLKLVDRRGGDERKTVTETHAQHILLQPNALRNEEQTRLQARELYDRIQNGEDFGTLAQRLSDDSGSKMSGGDLGWQPVGVFVPEFERALDGLRPGQVGQPFRSAYGWHLVKLLERRSRDATDETRRARARAAIQNRRAAEEYELWLRRLRAEAYVEYPQTSAS
ncbi:MAG: peptidylprolyl isomerase [Nevskiales bacterium]|nr:peptidylprolyl isomerase [Nevskiales bacterium]